MDPWSTCKQTHQTVKHTQTAHTETCCRAWQKKESLSAAGIFISSVHFSFIDLSIKNIQATVLVF